ncbi:thioredoxin [Aureimonas ureilytica]|uniref:Thioredoxin n=1 Tax=Aureimonas ureilytica TaxID=401562 RepID=A0A175REB1_9HYPH|nr:thioredoxin family protein [Aureimonas sp. D3]KTQ86464.1 thioredoxin [Aureimonas ureilytica]KTR01422.1 thioredoxin [Aureimonas ureilytica]
MSVMILRTAAAAIVLSVSAFASAAASAAEIAPFEMAAFEKAQTDGKPIVVDIAAPWCPTCAAQKPIIEKLAADPAHADMKIFHVSFDDQKDVVRALNARMQSTLIAFDGAKETGRSVGDTNPASIAALFASTKGE